jgi:hypothetical protein
VADGDRLLRSLPGPAEARRSALLELVPAVISYYSDGSSALAADFYEDERLAAGVADTFTAQTVVEDRTVRIRRGVAWASDPLFEGLDDETARRLAQVIQLEVARPYRVTILANRRRDSKAVGWRRVTSGTGCSFCRMLAARGVIYKHETARFASHDHCSCTAQPVFSGGGVGEEASVMQYVASRRSRTPKQQRELREYLAEFYA